MSVSVLKVGSAPLQSVFAFIGAALDVFGAAASAAQAVDLHRKPEDADLRTLGIDPKAFTVRL